MDEIIKTKKDEFDKMFKNSDGSWSDKTLPSGNYRVDLWLEAVLREVYEKGYKKGRIDGYVSGEFAGRQGLNKDEPAL